MRIGVDDRLCVGQLFSLFIYNEVTGSAFIR